MKELKDCKNEILQSFVLYSCLLSYGKTDVICYINIDVSLCDQYKIVRVLGNMG